MDSLTGPVPENWFTTSLGEICEIRIGSPQVDRVAESAAGRRFPVISARDITGDRLTADGPASPPDEVPPTLARYRVAPGDIVCARAGSLGRAVVVDGEHEGWLIGSSCLLLRPRAGLNPWFLLQYLRHPSVADWLDRTAMGAVIPTQRLSGLQAMPVVVPPEAEQDRIVDALSLLDEKIAVHREIVRVSIELRERTIRLLMAGALPGPASGPPTAGRA